MFFHQTNIVALDHLLRKLLFYIEKVCVCHSFTALKQKRPTGVSPFEAAEPKPGAVTILLVGHLRLDQVADSSRRGRFLLGVFQGLNRFLLVFVVLGLDRQNNAAVLTIHRGDLGFN